MQKRLKFQALTAPLVALLFGIAGVSVGQENVSYRYFYDDLGQLIGVADSAGTLVEYLYDPSGNIIEVRRSTVVGLAIFHFSPVQGVPGSLITIEGQGFTPEATANIVDFGGIPAVVSSASETQLVVTVPEGATSGPISVTVGPDTAVSSSDFEVLDIPFVQSVSPQLAVPGTTIDEFVVNGANLTGSTFGFFPSFPAPGVAVNSVSIDPAGSSATLSITIGENVLGTLAVVAANGVGSSDVFPTSPENRLEVVTLEGDLDSDGLSNGDEVANGTDVANPDTDGDQVPDGLEVEVGDNPLSPRLVVAEPRDMLVILPSSTATDFPLSTTVADPRDILVVLPGTTAAEFLPNTTVADPRDILVVLPGTTAAEFPPNTTVADPQDVTVTHEGGSSP